MLSTHASEVLEHIQQQLSIFESKKITSTNNHFIPHAVFEEQFGDSSGSSLKRMIQEVRDIYQIETNQKNIIPDGRKIFIALLMSGMPNLIDEFQKNSRLEDSRMPFSEDDLKYIMPKADNSIIRIVHERLMWLSSPKLKDGDYYDMKRPLPFLQILPMRESGRNSVVATVVVPWENLELDNDKRIPGHTIKYGLWEGNDYSANIKRVELVRKEVEDESVGKKEKKNLDRIPQHDNILHPISTFFLHSKDRRIESVNLIFPKLDGNLESFLAQREKDWDWTEDDLIRAFAGLMAGLDVMSKPPTETPGICDSAAHNDLKPANVLVDKMKKKFILCDFGSAEVMKAYHRKNSPPSDVTNEYLAPEAVYIKEPSDCTKRDIWAMGCILTEVVIYASSLDAPNVADFTNKRSLKWGHCSFFHVDRDWLHPEVDERLSAIEHSKLKEVVRIIRTMLHCDPSQRPCAENVAKELQSIANATDVSNAADISINTVSSVQIVSHPSPSTDDLPGEMKQQDSVDRITVDTSPVVDTIIQSQLQSSIEDLLREQTTEYENLLSRNNASRRKTEEKFPGRIRTLWDGQGKQYCIKTWAASSFHDIVLVCSPEKDMKNVMTIVITQIIQDLQSRTRLHVLRHFYEHPRTSQPLQIASSLLGQLSRLHPYNTRSELFHILNQQNRDARQTMDEFIAALSSPSRSLPLVIIIHQIGQDVGSRDEPSMWQQIGQVILPLIELINRKPSVGPDKRFPWIKLLVSTTLQPPGENSWQNLSTVTLMNKPNKHKDRDVRLNDFWGRQILQWFSD
ncbi:kinase-like domain-containing protein [Nemania serpens]|nr:kinase-like domain-containing protein [Nemania serpens]